MEIEKMSLHSMDLVDQNREKLKQLFPSVFMETVNDKGKPIETIDFEKLKAELGTFSDLFDNRRERYGLDWPGKKDALKLIQKPSVATLKPYRDENESVNFDETENLFIEGDNLEVLKLLQKAYYGKIKMIYIDPPYNTGKEFIYPDNYSESLDTYLAYAGLADDQGRKFATNTQNEGRYHTKWLNMMYPRLYLAKNLLRDDGVIFISIDDNEVTNLRKLCDELFGEENFTASFPWRKRTAKSDVPFGVSQDFEWIVVYAKSEFKAGFFVERKYQYTDDFDCGWRLADLTNQRTAQERPNSFFTMINPKDGAEYPANPNRVWAVTKDTFQDYYDRGKIVFPGDYDFLRISTPAFRVFESEDIEKNIQKYGMKEAQRAVSTLLPKEVGMTEDGTAEITALFDRKIFPFTKPSMLIKYLISIIPDDNFIVLDFFAGSATTAHAVLDLNKEDGGNRKFIMVQLPEPCEENTEAYQAGYKTIADIGKERIRRVTRQIEQEQNEAKQKADGALPGLGEEVKELDLGFKVFKLDKSNFKIWDGSDPNASEEELVKQLQLHINHIDPNSSQEDIFYELLLKAGYMPSEKVIQRTMAGKTIYSIDDGSLLICLEDEITKELIGELAKAGPKQVICLDQSFKGNDQLKANAMHTFAAQNEGKDKGEQIVFRTV